MKNKKTKKAEMLFDAVGEIDDALLEEAVAYRRKRRVGTRVLALAATFAVVLTMTATAFFVLNTADGGNKSKRHKRPGSDIEYGEDATGSVNNPEDVTDSNNESIGGIGGIEGDYGEDGDMMSPEFGEEMEGGADMAPNPGEPGSDEGIETGTEGGNGGDDIIESMPQSLITNPFINTADNNTSTFSADVDTASYSYFRALVNAGYKFNDLRNSGTNFRIEEFINYFKYEATAPTGDELFGVEDQIIYCPWNDNTFLLRVTLQAEEALPTSGNNLVFLIDVSGSMSSQDKLPLLKKAFTYLVENLGPNDTISIVTYSGNEAVVLDGCSGINTDAIMNAINSLVASGSTNGEAGLKMAYQIAEKHYIEGGNNRIIMASDGDLNVGISSAEELKAFIEQKRDQGVYLSVLGFGRMSYSDANMEALADNGNGVYYYIDGETEAEKVFGTDLTGTLYTVANDVKLQIAFDPEIIESYRIIGYDNRVLNNEDFENDRKDAGDVGASHQVTVFYEIVLKPDVELLYCDSVATLSVRYKLPGETLSLLNEYDIGTGPYEADEDLHFIPAVIEFVALLRNKDYNGDVTLQSILRELDSIDLTDPYKIEFRELVRSLAQD